MLFEVFLRNSIVFLLLALILIIFGTIIFTRSYHLKEGRLAALCVLAYGISNFIEYIRHTVDVEYSYAFHIWGSSIFALLGLALSTALLCTHMRQNPLITMRFSFNSFIFYSPILVYGIAQMICYTIEKPRYYQENNWYFSDATLAPIIMYATSLWYVLLLCICIVEGILVAPKKLKINFFFNGIGIIVSVLSYVLILHYAREYLTPDPLITMFGLTSFSMIALSLFRFDEFSPSVAKHYQALLQLSPSAILVIDQDLKVQEVNAIARRLFVIEKGNSLRRGALNNNLKLLLNLYKDLLTYKKIEKKIFHFEQEKSEQIIHLLVDGKIVTNQQKQSYFFVIQDITKKYEQEQSNYHLAYHDSLTSLPNRAHFMQQVKPLLKQVTHTAPGIFFVMDLNFFKHINDTYGHHIGDEVLKHTAKLLQVDSKKHDLIARLGGDEFVGYIPETSEGNFRSRLQAWRIYFAMHPYVHHDTHIEVVPSFGYAVATPECNDYEMLYQLADARMYNDKQFIKGQQKISI